MMRDPDTWPRWQPEIVHAAGPDPLWVGDVVDGVALMLGFFVHGRSTITSVAADHLEEEVVVGVRIRVRYDLSAAPDGSTLITHRLFADLPQGVSGRVLSFFLKWRLRRMQRHVLDRVGIELEGRG